MALATRMEFQTKFSASSFHSCVSRSRKKIKGNYTVVSCKGKDIFAILNLHRVCISNKFETLLVLSPKNDETMSYYFYKFQLLLFGIQIKLLENIVISETYKSFLHYLQMELFTYNFEAFPSISDLQKTFKR